MPSSEDVRLDARVLVVGGGPSGLAVAACLKSKGVHYVQVDRNGAIGGAYRKMFPSTELLSPAKYTQLPGLPIETSDEYVTAGRYREYLVRYATHHQLEIVEATVTQITPADQGFHVHYQDSPTSHHYDAVVLATGIVDHPMIPAIVGLDTQANRPRVIHSRDWQGCDPFRDQKLLIVGAGMSGVEIAEQCADAGLAVTISARKRVRLWKRRVVGIDIHHIVHLFSHRLPLWVAGSYCRKLPALGAFDRGFRNWLRRGRIRVRGEVNHFDGKEAHFKDGSKECFDAVILATGYRWHPPCLPAGIETGEAGHPLTVDGEIVRLPGLFVIGAPCGRILPSEFLHGVKHDAPVIAEKIAMNP